MPTSLDLGDGSLPPFPVERWLRDGDRIDLGGMELDVIHAPGEVPDHICLLDRRDGILFCGDVLLERAVWTHLDGGSLPDFVGSYRSLMESFDHICHLMPSHKCAMARPLALAGDVAGAEAVLESGRVRVRHRPVGPPAPAIPFRSVPDPDHTGAR